MGSSVGECGELFDVEADGVVLVAEEKMRSSEEGIVMDQRRWWRRGRRESVKGVKEGEMVVGQCL